MTAILEARTTHDSDLPATPVFAAPIGHPSAWTVADFRSPADYSVDLEAAQLRDIAAAVRHIKAAGIGLDRLQREHFEVPSLRPVVEEIRRQVEDGRGFVLLRQLPIKDYSHCSGLQLFAESVRPKPRPFNPAGRPSPRRREMSAKR